MLSTKLEMRNKQQISSDKKTKVYDLEDRTFNFARRIRAWIDKLPKTMSNVEDSKQLIRSSGSVGANYIEANDSLSKKDFIMRVKISRKEAKESKYWLQLLQVNGSVQEENEQKSLIQESTEIMNILGAILRNSK